MAQEWLQHQERSTPLALHTIRWIALHLGRPAARGLLYPITAYFLLFAPASRRASRAFLRRVPGRHPGVWQVARHMHCFASVILDRVFLLTGREEVLDVTVHHCALLDSMVARGQGGLLLGAHFGSFEVLRALAVNRVRYDIRVVMRRRHNALLTRVLDELNPDVARAVIDLDDPRASLMISEAINEGALVGILADRTAGSDDAVRHPFLGAPAPFPTGPLRLAAVTGAPVVQFFGVYHGGNRYAIHFESLYEGGAVPRHERGAWLEAMIGRYAERLEAHVRAAPENWFNFYDFWR